MTPTGATTVEGTAAATAIVRAIEAFPPAIGYVRAQVAPEGPFADPVRVPADGLWLRSAQLCTDPAWLAEVVRASGRQLGTGDDMVAASLFVQNYSYRVLMVAVACATVAGVVPACAAGDMAVTMTNGRPHVVGYLANKALLVDGLGAGPTTPLTEQARSAVVDWLLEQAIDQHLRCLVGTIREGIRVGGRLLWGNIASSAATAFRTMDGCLGDWARPLGEQFFRCAPNSLQGLGAFLALERAGRTGWFWERTNCCLYENIPGNPRCSDCSRTPAADRRAGYEATLVGEDV